MKKLQIAVAALTLLLAGGTSALYAGTSGPIAGTATALIIAPLSLVHAASTKMDFGTIVSGTAGTVTLAAKDGTATTAGLAGHYGPTTNDHFTVTGAANIPFVVSLPASITVTSGANNMTVSALTSFCGTAATSSCVASTTGTQVGVGGTLSVVPSQAVGPYTGSYNVSITY